MRLSPTSRFAHEGSREGRAGMTPAPGALETSRWSMTRGVHSVPWESQGNKRSMSCLDAFVARMASRLGGRIPEGTQPTKQRSQAG